MSGKRILTTREAAAACGISPKRFRRLVKAGEIWVGRLSTPKRWRFPAAAVEKFLEDALPLEALMASREKRRKRQGRG